jgi:hypothetical protein
MGQAEPTCASVIGTAKHAFAEDAGRVSSSTLRLIRQEDGFIGVNEDGLIEPC